MSSSSAPLRRAKQRYRAALPDADPAWPYDVQTLYDALSTRLFRTEVRIGSLRDELNLRTRRVEARFERHVGRTPKAFLVHHRIEMAKRLLTRHDLSVTKVAFEVGYDRPNSFSSLFKRHTGVTPSTWRSNV
jgi:AraC-like DNA-binding protein